MCCGAGRKSTGGLLRGKLRNKKPAWAAGWRKPVQEERGSWVWEKVGAARGWGEDSPAKGEKSLTMDSGSEGV